MILRKPAALAAAAAAAFLFATTALAQQSEIDQAFAGYENAWKTADKAAIAKLAADDLVWITRGGREMTKQEFIQVFNPKIGMANIRDKKVRLYGQVAVMTYAAEEGSSAIRRTIVWNKTPQGWKMVTVQATAIQK